MDSSMVLNCMPHYQFSSIMKREKGKFYRMNGQFHPRKSQPTHLSTPTTKLSRGIKQLDALIPAVLDAYMLHTS